MELTRKTVHGTFAHMDKSFAGLVQGQMRSRPDKLTHNSGWYNRAGEKVGWGDLSFTDINRIISDLEEDEVFIILAESDSFWEFVTHNPGPTGDFATTDAKEQCPGLEYLVERAIYFVTKDGLHGFYAIQGNHPVEIHTVSRKLLAQKLGLNLQ